MKPGHLRYFIVLIAFLFSCEKEFDPTGDWQEGYAAYCLLNLKDSVQYVRINRVFLSSGNPADYFQQLDSVSVDPAVIEVSLQALLDDIPDGDPVFFIPTDEFPKDSGMFATDHNIIYKSREPLKNDRSYRLTINNLKTGYHMEAETELLGNRTLAFSFTETRFYNINQYSPESIDYNGSLVTSQFARRVHRLLYYEYRGEERVMKYIDWRTPYPDYKSSMEEDTAQIPDIVFEYWGENIPVEPGVRRKAVGMDKMLILNNDLVRLYIGYYDNLTSGQYMPDMTNFDQGSGLFASRYYYTFFAMKLKPKTIDSLAYGRFTKELGFADASGNWPPLK